MIDRRKPSGYVGFFSDYDKFTLASDLLDEACMRVREYAGGTGTITRNAAMEKATNALVDAVIAGMRQKMTFGGGGHAAERARLRRSAKP